MLSKEKSIPTFLSGGGEVGECIRKFDWRKTSLGEPETWPQSLRTTVSTCLNSSFPILIWWGPDLVMIYNDAYRPILGTKHPSSMGEKGKTVWPEIWEIIGPMLYGVYDEGLSTWSENQLLLLERKGYAEECYFTFSYSPIYVENGGVGGVFCAVTETTRTVQNERQSATSQDLNNLQTSNKQLNDVFSAASKALEKNDKDFPCSFIHKIENDGASVTPFEILKTKKIKNAAILEKNVLEAFCVNKMVLAETNSKWKNFPKGAWDIMPKHFLSVPIYGLTKTNPIAVLSTTLNPYREFDNDYRNFIQLVANQISTEVSNVLAIEEERKRTEALAEIDKAKTLFFTNISHEFRTPLTLMLGSLEELLNKKDDRLLSRNTERIETAHRNAMRLLRLVNTLLDFSRIEAGRVNAQFEITDITSFTANIASNFRSVVEAAGLAFNIRCDSFIQPVYIDKEMWEKIVLNLLSNAFKYTLKGSITVSIAVEGKNVVLKISDTGVGIPENELPKIFQRFHRSQKTVGRSYEGTGIGLALVNELVKLHEGQIYVTSKEDYGTEFTVTIPIGKNHLPASQIMQKESDFRSLLSDTFIDEATTLIEKPFGNQIEIKGTNSPTILIVDDNTDMRSYIKSLLHDKYNVTTSNNGADALKLMKASLPDLILSDIMMPVMDGIQLLKAVKENPVTQNIPVILLSARAGEESKIEGYETGADDYLIKPFSTKELIARVASQIKIKKTRFHIEEQMRNLFIQSPVAITILRGPDYVVEIANEKVLEIWAITEEQVINKPLFKAAPYLAGQGFEQLLENVYKTGKRFISGETPVYVQRNGKTEELFIKFIYEPFHEQDGSISGIMAVALEVTEQVNARNKIEKSKKELQHLFRHAPAAIAVVNGPDHVYTLANPLYQKLFGRTEEQLMGHSIRQVWPELEGQSVYELFDKVFSSGKPFIAQEFPVTFIEDGKTKNGYFDFVAQPIENEERGANDIMIHAFEVTEQVISLKKIEEKEEQLRIALEGGELGTYDYYLDTGELIWSAKTKELFGLRPNEEANFDQYLNALHPEDKKRTKDALDKARDRQNGYLYENEYRTIGINDGKERWIRSKGKISFDSNGKPFRLTGVTQEITKQKHAEERLQYAATLTQNIADAIVATSLDLKIMSWNKGAENLYGYTEEEVIGCAAKEIISTEFLSETEEEGWLNAVKNGSKWQGEVVQKKKDGTVLNVLSSVAYVRNSQGEPIAAVAVNRDITERKIAEQQLKEYYNRIKTILESLPQIAWTTDAKGKADYFNTKWSEFTGLTKSESQGTGWVQALHPDDMLRVSSEWDNAIRYGDSIKTEFRLRTADGNYKWHFTVAVPQLNNEGEITSWIGTSTNIDEQKVKEQKKDEFISIASHEMKTPLTTANAYIQLLEASLNEENNNATLYAKKAGSSIKRLNALITELLDVSKINNGRLNYNISTFNFDEMIDSSVENIQHSSLSHLIIKSGNVQQQISGDKERLQQVVINLLSNAIKYSPGTGKVFIDIEKANDEIKVAVKDSGIGISKDNLKKIFQRYYRVEEQAVQFQGLGIGLFISSEIIERHHGNLWAESELGKGSTFYFTIPFINTKQEKGKL
jgi:PAS domain S-box-containing protein